MAGLFVRILPFDYPRRKSDPFESLRRQSGRYILGMLSASARIGYTAETLQMEILEELYWNMRFLARIAGPFS